MSASLLEHSKAFAALPRVYAAAEQFTQIIVRDDRNAYKAVEHLYRIHPKLAAFVEDIAPPQAATIDKVAIFGGLLAFVASEQVFKEFRAARGKRSADDEESVLESSTAGKRHRAMWQRGPYWTEAGRMTLQGETRVLAPAPPERAAAPTGTQLVLGF